MEALTEGEPSGGLAPASEGGGALVFVGFMGAGKTSSARSVAAEMGVAPLDSDRELEAAIGEPIEAFFDREGEPAFREREEQAVLAVLDRARSGGVVALGGGATGSERVCEALRDHTVVHLEVEPDEAWRRATGKGRPLARDRGRFDQLHADRRTVYQSVAHAVLRPRAATRRAARSMASWACATPGRRGSGTSGWSGRSHSRATTRCS